MKELITKLLVKIDIFGQPVSLTLNSRNTSKTLIGGTTTVLFFISLLSIFSVLVKEVLDKNEPIVRIENRILYPRPEIVLSNSTLGVAFGLSNEGSYFLTKPEYFKMKAGVFNNRNEDTTNFKTTYLPLKQCAKEDFPQIDNETFDNQFLDQMLCIENLNVTLKGFWDEEIIQYLTVEIYYCVNETESDQCANFDEIKSFIQEQPYFFNIFLLNSDVNSQNNLSPISYNILNLYKGLISTKSKISEIYLKYETLLSDDGFFFKSNNTFKTVSFDYSTPDDTDLTSHNRMVAFYIMTSNKSLIHHRIYKKLTDILGLLGGLSNVIMIILKLVCYLFSKSERDEKILNKIYDFDLESEGNDESFNRNIFNNNFSIVPLKDNKIISNKIILTKNKDKPQITSLEISNINENSKSRLKLLEIQRSLDPKNNLNTKKGTKNCEKQIKNSTFLVDYDKDYVRAIKDFKRKKEANKLKLTNLQILIVSLCKCLANKNLKLKKALYDKSSTYLNSIIDISNVVCKLEEFEKLKLILLSNEQHALFQFIAKDYVSMNKEVSKYKNKITAMKNFYNDQVNLGNIMNNFFKQMKKEHFINSTDDKIIDMLDEDL